MLESVNAGLELKQQAETATSPPALGGEQSMGCAQKRSGKQKKKTIFSLQELLCKDVETLNTSSAKKNDKKSKAKKKNSKAKPVPEEDEFELFIKK